MSTESPLIGSPDNPKTTEWVCYFTFIGWLIAYFGLYKKNKSEFTSFHMRQSLMIHILSLMVKIIYSFYFGAVAIVLMIVLFIVWIIAFLDALNNRMRPLPVIGRIAQRVFQRL